MEAPSLHNSDALEGLADGCSNQVQVAGRLSARGAFLLVTKINWGIGLVAMPYYLHCAGLWAGLIFFVITMALSLDSALIVSRLREQVPSCRDQSSYAGVIGGCLGAPGRHLAVLSLVLANWGSAIGWAKYVGDNLAHFLPLALPSDSYILVLTLLLLGCAFVEDVAPLERVSLAGLAAGQTFVLLILAQAAWHWQEFGSYASSQPAVRWDTAPVAMGLAVFCNEGMVALTPSVHAAMRVPSAYGKAVTAMAAFFTLNYMLTAVAGDFMFSFLKGSVVPAEVSLAFDRRALDQAAVYFYIFQLLVTFPLCFMVLFVSVECTWMPGATTWARRAVRLLLILSAGLAAAAVPRFGEFLAAAGGLANSLGIYILPHWALLRAAKRQEVAISPNRRIASLAVILVFGLAAGAVSTLVSVRDLFAAGSQATLHLA